MEMNPLSKEQVEKAKQAQELVISECDKALADLQHNISVLNDLVAQQNAKKKLAQDTIGSLEGDFPMLKTTTPLGSEV